MRFGNSPAVLIDEVYRSRNFDGSFGRNCLLRRASLVGIAGRGFSRRPCDEEHNDGAPVQQRNDRYRNRCLLQQPLFADGFHGEVAQPVRAVKQTREQAVHAG